MNFESFTRRKKDIFIKLNDQFNIFATLENILLSMFTYENLPRGLQTQFIEKSLIRTGNVLLVKWDESEYYSGTVTYQGELDKYGINETGFTLTKNGLQSKTAKLCYEVNNITDDSEHTLIFNNSERLSITSLYMFTDMLSEILTSMRCNLKNSRLFPIPVARNSKIKSAIDGIIKNMDKGETSAVVNELTVKDITTILQNDSKMDYNIPVMNLTDVKAVEYLQYLTKFFDDVIRIFATQFGISINSSGKMAQQNNIELQGYEHFSKIIPLDMLKCRQTGIDIFNKINGTNVVVRFSDAWSRLVEDDTEEPEPKPEPEPETEPDTEDKGGEDDD